MRYRLLGGLLGRRAVAPLRHWRHARLVLDLAARTFAARGRRIARHWRRIGFERRRFGQRRLRLRLGPGRRTRRARRWLSSAGTIARRDHRVAGRRRRALIAAAVPVVITAARLVPVAVLVVKVPRRMLMAAILVIAVPPGQFAPCGVPARIPPVVIAEAAVTTDPRYGSAAIPAALAQRGGVKRAPALLQRRAVIARLAGQPGIKPPLIVIDLHQIAPVEGEARIGIAHEVR